MSKPAARHRGQPATDLLEEAIRLLRSAPFPILLSYFVGSIPAMLAALYFLADLSGSADAEARLFPSSVGLAVAYLWMKCWQSVFAGGLRAVLLLEEPAPWTASRIVKLVAAQAALQPTGLILRPLAMALTLPYVWTSTFYLNVTVLGDGGHGGLRELWQRAYTQCRLWPKQAHVVAVLLTVFGFFIWVNVAVLMLNAPALLKMFFGVETMLSRHLVTLDAILKMLFSPSFLAASFAATYLCLDPIRKAAAVLRCFHGSSLQSGADLLVQLRSVRQSAARGPAVLAAILLCFTTLYIPPAQAAFREEPKIESSELNRSLDDVLERREFAWRLPRDRQEAGNAADGWFGQMQKNFEQWMERARYQAGRWIGKIARKISDWFSKDSKRSESKTDWLSVVGSVRILFYALLVVAAVLLIVIVARYRRRPRLAAAQAEPLAPRPDLSEENVTADQLPEEGWLQLARELMQNGEMRLALRASYLASLAHLGQREFIRLARHKSNRDYESELRRRARGQAELLSAFGENLLSFERAWYGEHIVTPDTLGDFTARLETIRAC